MYQTPTNRQGITYEYFVCLGRLNKKTSCHMSAIPVDWAEHQVEELYRDIQTPDSVLATLRGRLQKQLEEANAATTERKAQLVTQRRSLQTKQQKLLEAYYNPGGTHGNRAKTLKSSLKKVERQLGPFDSVETKASELLDIALNLAYDCHSAYRAADDLGKRELNQVFFEKVYICSDEAGDFHAHAHLNPWTLALRSSSIIQNDAMRYEHEEREDLFSDPKNKSAARSEDLPTDVNSLSCTRICPSTMVRQSSRNIYEVLSSATDHFTNANLPGLMR